MRREEEGNDEEMARTLGSLSKHCHARAKYSICLVDNGIFWRFLIDSFDLSGSFEFKLSTGRAVS